MNRDRARTRRWPGILLITVLIVPHGAAVCRGQSQVMQSIQYGTVVSVADAVVREESTGVGAVVGSTAGAVAGAAIARGSGSWLGGLMGGVLGGVAGHAIEKAAQKKKGVELIINLEKGEEVGIQIPNKQAGLYRKGDRVRLMSAPGGRTTVTVVDQ